MTTRPTQGTTTGDVSPRTAALVAGAGYLALFVLAGYANFVVIEGMVVAGDPAATLGAIAAAPGRLRLGLTAFAVITVIDVVIAWALHVLLRDIAPDRSLLAAWMRVLHSVFLGVGVAALVRVDALVAGVGDSGAGADVAGEVMLALDGFDGMWMLGLAFFGVHLVLVATLLVRHVAAPRVLRLVLVLAGVAYVVDTGLHLLLADYEAVASVMLTIVAVPSVLGEGWFGGWLLWRGTGSRTLRPATDGAV